METFEGKFDPSTNLALQAQVASRNRGDDYEVFLSHRVPRIKRELAFCSEAAYMAGGIYGSGGAMPTSIHSTF